jgi:hypothetical protein
MTVVNGCGPVKIIGMMIYGCTAKLIALLNQNRHVAGVKAGWPTQAGAQHLYALLFNDITIH